MPELPEVETTRLGLLPFAKDQSILKVHIKNPNLRWKVDPTLKKRLVGQTVLDIKRRAKYLLFELDQGTLIGHLGMSGHFKVVPSNNPWLKHDHFGLELGDYCLRLNDPRRFGAILYTQEDWQQYPQLAHLGPEPLERAFHGQALWQRLQTRKGPIKSTLMDNKVVVGVGNIYACESLYRAKISPFHAAHTLSLEACQRLVTHIKAVLNEAIKAGGTTLKDFQHGEGKLGFFQQHLQVYGRLHEPCNHCFEPIEKAVLGQRATYYCPKCQK